MVNEATSTELDGSVCATLPGHALLCEVTGILSRGGQNARQKSTTETSQPSPFPLIFALPPAAARSSAPANAHAVSGARTRLFLCNMTQSMTRTYRGGEQGPGREELRQFEASKDRFHLGNARPCVCMRVCVFGGRGGVHFLSPSTHAQPDR